jgi:hypothetical protein
MTITADSVVVGVNPLTMPTLHVGYPCVFRRAQELQVLKPIIGLDVVEMVNVFVRAKIAAKVGLHYEAMLQNITARACWMLCRILLDISILPQPNTALPLWACLATDCSLVGLMARLRAKAGRLMIQPILVDMKHRTANLARNRDRWFPQSFSGSLRSTGQMSGLRRAIFGVLPLRLHVRATGHGSPLMVEHPHTHRDSITLGGAAW